MSGAAESTVLTEEDVRRAMDIIRDGNLRLCGVTTPHVVHPEELKRGGKTVCANCLQPVELPKTGSEA